MKIILMTDVDTLGRRGEVREVATGYARNYLLPRKLAVPATPLNLKNVDQLRRQRDREEARTLELARSAAERIAGLAYAVSARASEDGRLYGSVTAQDVVTFLERQQLAIEKRRVLLDEPIKTLGEHAVSIRLHPEVTATLAVTVTPE